VLKPGGVFIVSFSNRMFYEKAISAWRDGSGFSRAGLVKEYFQCVQGFTKVRLRGVPRFQRLGLSGHGLEFISRFRVCLVLHACAGPEQTRHC